MSVPAMNRIIPLTILMMVVLAFVGFLRLSGYEDSLLTPFAELATPLYVAATVLFFFWFRGLGIEFNSLGFRPRLSWSHLGLAIAAVVFLQLNGAFVSPLIEEALGGSRDLSRFDHIEGSLSALLMTLALSWSFAAFGEEIAFRIVLMRALVVSLGESRLAWIIAVVLQALVFGLVHMYQGQTGIAGATISGLVFGTVTALARGSIWPAALAHGINNSIGLVTIYLGG